MATLKLRRLLGREPLAWAMSAVLQRIIASVRHRWLAIVLNAPGISVGQGSIFRGVRHIRFGRSFRANGSVWIEAVQSYGDESFEPMILIGANVSASNDLHISCIARVEIGNGVLFGSRVYVSDHNHGDYRSANPVDAANPQVAPSQRALGGGGPVTIGDNVWIGHNVVIVGPCVIGEGSVIGANSVVRGNVPPRTIVAGVPAIVVKRYDSTIKIWKRAH